VHGEGLAEVGGDRSLCIKAMIEEAVDRMYVEIDDNRFLVSIRGPVISNAPRAGWDEPRLRMHQDIRDLMACAGFSLLRGSSGWAWGGGWAGLVGVHVARGCAVGQPIMLSHKAFHPVCQGQCAGNCSIGLRVGAAEPAGKLTRSWSRMAPRATT
jgi:hypothetical protein